MAAAAAASILDSTGPQRSPSQAVQDVSGSRVRGMAEKNGGHRKSRPARQAFRSLRGRVCAGTSGTLGPRWVDGDRGVLLLPRPAMRPVGNL